MADQRGTGEHLAMPILGTGFFGTLGLIFIVLKLVHVINWSWWLVLLPLYGGILLILSVAVVVFLVALVFNLLE